MCLTAECLVPIGVSIEEVAAPFRKDASPENAPRKLFYRARRWAGVVLGRFCHDLHFKTRRQVFSDWLFVFAPAHN
jgi:hypothetical protein